MLDDVCFAYHTSIHSSTQETPFFLLFGRDPNIPIRNFLDAIPRSTLLSSDFVSLRMESLSVAFQRSREENTKAREQQRAQYNKMGKIFKYQGGDRVLLDIKVRPENASRKFVYYRVLSSVIIHCLLSIEYPRQLLDFVGPRSWVVFELLGLKNESLYWMMVPLCYWEKMFGYSKIEEIIRGIEVVNDCAERAVKLITDFKDVCVNVEEQQSLFQLIEDHRKHFNTLRKQNFMNV